MFYNFEEETEEKRFYSYMLGDLASLSEEELQEVAEVKICGMSDDDEHQENCSAYLERLKNKVSHLQHITKLKADLSYFSPELIRKMAECFPYLKNIYFHFSEFSADAIAALQNFPHLRTLKINDYAPETYYRLQEFGHLKQLRNLIIENSGVCFFNLDSLAFLKSMNLEKLEIENLISVYTPVINGQFNRLQNHKKLLQREQLLSKYMEAAAPGNDSCLKAAAELFFRGKIEKGIEYLYMYARDDQSDMPIPFTVSQDPENREVLHWQWHDNEKLIIDYFQKRNFLLKIYPKTQTSLADFDCYLSV